MPVPALLCLLLTVALSGAAGPGLTDLPPWQTFAIIEEITPEMHWYQVDYDDVERSSCEVGVPTDPSLRPRLRCWFPGAYATEHPRVPGFAAAGARQAVREVRRHSRQDRGRARSLDVRYLGTWRKLLLRDVVLRVPGPPDQAILSSTRGAFRLDPSRGLVLLRDAALGETDGGTGLLCYGLPCTADGLLDWAPPADIDGSSVLHGLIWEPDARAAMAWPALERAALEAVAAMDEGRWIPATPRPRENPGVASTAATWALTVYRQASDGTRSSQRVLIPLDLSQARQAPVTVHRRSELFGVDITARIDLPGERLALGVAATGLGETSDGWPLPPLGLAPHGALPGSTSLGIPYQELQLRLGSDGAPGSLMVAADPALHAGSLAPIPAGVRLPVAGERRGDRVVWTAWEWLDPGASRVLGLRLEACPGARSDDGCSVLLQGGTEVPSELLVQLPEGPVELEIEVFDTDQRPEHMWQPARGDYRCLWTRRFTAAVVPPSENPGGGALGVPHGG